MSCAHASMADMDTMMDAALCTLGLARRTLAADAQIFYDAAEAPKLQQQLDYLGTVGIIDLPRAGRPLPSAKRTGPVSA